MKPYHEVAIVKDGNKRVGWLLKEGLSNSPNPVFFVTEDYFNTLVKNNMVQHFVWKNSGLAISYDVDEINYFKRKGISPKYNTLSEYLKYNLALQYKYLYSALDGNTPYVHVINYSSHKNVILITAFLFSSDLNSALSVIRNILNSNYYRFYSFLANTLEPKGNYISLTLPLEVFEYLKNWNISCSAIKSSKKSRIFRKNSGMCADVNSIVKRIETV